MSHQLLCKVLVVLLVVTATCSLVVGSRPVGRRLQPLLAHRHISSSRGLLPIITFTASSWLLLSQPSGLPQSSLADDLGANVTSNTKIMKGGASTLQRGIAKASSTPTSTLL